MFATFRNDYTEIFKISIISKMQMHEKVIETSIEKFSQISSIQIRKKEKLREKCQEIAKNFSTLIQALG